MLKKNTRTINSLASDGLGAGPAGAHEAGQLRRGDAAMPNEFVAWPSIMERDSSTGHKP